MRKQFSLPAFAAALALLAAPAALADYSNAVMSLNPSGYWQLNEATAPPAATTPSGVNLGTLGSAQDASFSGDVVFGYPGALAGSTDSADAFNGFIDARTTVPYSPDVSTAPSFSVEAWLLANDDGTFWGVTCPLSDFEANSPRAGWLLYANIANNGQYTFRTYATNGTAFSLSLDLGTPGSIEIGKWYHVAIVVSNAVTVTNVYGFINGSLAAGPAALPGYVPNDGNAGGFSIGNRSDSGSGYTYVGAIDEVAYYTNALDPATILAHYQAGTNPSPATAYSTLVLQSHPALYYHLDEAPAGQPYPVALPVAVNRGSLGAAANGYYQPGTTPGVAGPTNSGFGPVSRACNFTAVKSGNQAGPGVLCDVFNQPLLNISPALSLTAWIRVPSNPLNFQTPVGRGDTSYRLSIDTSGMPHFAANPNGDVTGTSSVADGQWHFWAGVFDPVTSKSYLYIDSLLVAQGPGNPPQNMSCFLLMGGAPDYSDRGFVGDICHVALFTNALSAGQIASLYNVVGAAPSVFLPTNGITLNEGANGGITATVAGTPPLAMQWYYTDNFGVTNVAAGQTNAALSLTNVLSAQSGNSYFLAVSNAYGAVTSSVVALTVVQGPPILQVDLTPASQQVPVGAAITYNVVVTGSLPFHYQWFRDGTLISGETNSSYTFPALNGSHTYSCTVTNNFPPPVNSAVVTLVGVVAPPPVITFNNTGTGWTINHNANMLTAGIVNNVLTLTDGTNSQTATAFFNTPQYIGGFAAFFTYQEADGTAPLADGVTFCVQNSAAGASALGGGGGELGYTGIGNSAAFEINIYNGANGGRGIQFGTNGMTADSPIPTPPYFAPGPVNLASGHPINVRVYFSQGTYHVHLADATTGDSFLTTFNQGDLRGAIGADSAYVGFTGATGGLNAIQKVSNFRFSYTTPPVLSVTHTGTSVVVAWPVSVATFFTLEKSSSLAGPWTSAGAPTVVGAQNQVTQTATGTAQFYRLVLQ